MNTRHLRFASNRVSDIINCYRSTLAPLYPAGEIESMVRRLFEAFLGWDTVQLLLHRSATINQSDLLRFHWALLDLERHRPLQHIIGYTEFCDCHIEVSPDVLIPRPETEQLVHCVLELSKRSPEPPRILDLCTGSGCIAIALAHALPQATVEALDISAAALTIARRNATINHADITFHHADLLRGNLPLSSRYDIIVSNPPYVMDHERELMEPNVLDYEPAIALFVPDDDPLRFYRAIARTALQTLAPQGIVIVEINEQLGDATAQLFSSHGFTTSLLKDYNDKDRILIAQ